MSDLIACESVAAVTLHLRRLDATPANIGGVRFVTERT